MFTDGLIESRDQPFDIGVAELASHLATLRDRVAARQLVDSVLDTMLGDAKAADDIAILVVEHTA